MKVFDELDSFSCIVLVVLVVAVLVVVIVVGVVIKFSLSSWLKIKLISLSSLFIFNNDSPDGSGSLSEGISYKFSWIFYFLFIIKFANKEIKINKLLFY